jgi:hypothetical protein
VRCSRGHSLINGSNHLDYKLILVQILKHVLDDTQEKVLLLHFDDTAGPIYNLLRHLGCRIDDHLKSGKLLNVKAFHTDRYFCRWNRMATD